MEQKQMHVRVADDVATAIQRLSQQTGESNSRIMEDLLREALAARENAQYSTTTLMQKVVHAEITRLEAEFPSRLADAMQMVEKARYKDISTLLIRAIHQAGLAWRLTYVSLALNIPEADLRRVFDEAEQRVLEQLQHLDIKGAES